MGSLAVGDTQKRGVAIERLMKHMDGVLEYQNVLNNLGGRWEMLTLLGQMSGTGIDMSKTREGFQTLSSKLLSSLAKETLKKVASEINLKAQVAVDIVIRNLFERTADIGFLATDDDIRLFIKDHNKIKFQISELSTGGYADRISTYKTELESKKKAIISRFEEYVLKYSVYYDIILCDTDGNILAELDKTSKNKKSSDPLIKEALETTKEYVETLRYSDLQPDINRYRFYTHTVLPIPIPMQIWVF